MLLLWCGVCYSLTEALPDTLEAVLEAAQQAADTQSMGDAQQWQLHRDIITESFAALLSRFVDDGSTQVSLHSHVLQQHMCRTNMCVHR